MKRPVKTLGVQFWEKHPPTKQDAVHATMRLLGMLAEALPIALDHIGSKDLNTQYEFWMEFSYLERETDLVGDLASNESIREKLSSWGEIAGLRKHHPTEDLSA